MFFLALLMIPLVLIQVTAQDPDVLFAVEVANGLIWLAFVVELVLLRRRIGTWRPFLRGHWLDLAIVLFSPPFFVPPQLASLRVLRLLRLVRLLAIIGRLQQGAGRATGRQGLAYVGLLAIFMVFIGGVSLHELEPERAPTVWEGMWWAVVTLTTVGYGDIIPASFEGRVLAALLMISGLGAFGALAGSVGALFMAHEEDDVTGRLDALQRQLDRIEARSNERETGPR